MEAVTLVGKARISGTTVEVAKSKINVNRERADQGIGREMSMLQDIRQGRPVAFEAIVGNTVRFVRRDTLKIPRLETLYALLKRP